MTTYCAFMLLSGARTGLRVPMRHGDQNTMRCQWNPDTQKRLVLIEALPWSVCPWCVGLSRHVFHAILEKRVRSDEKTVSMDFLVTERCVENRIEKCIVHVPHTNFTRHHTSEVSCAFAYLMKRMKQKTHPRTSPASCSRHIVSVFWELRGC